MNMHLTAGWISILRIGTCWDEEVYREIGLGMSDDRLMNHKLHIILTFITLGMWWPFYLGLYLYYKFSDSTIDKRRERRGINKEPSKGKKEINEAKKVERLQLNNGLSKPYKGYKQGKKGIFHNSQAYMLACSHQIRATKQVGMFSKGLLNKTVWCDICNADRIVTGTRDPWNT